MDEDRFKLALAEADAYILSQLPTGNEYEHDFSRPFVRKIRKLIRKENFSPLSKIRQIAAAILIFLVLSAGTLIAAGKNARASLLYWIVHIRHDASGRDSYWYEGNSDQHRNVSAYTLAELVPKRYTLIERIDEGTYVSETYLHANGSLQMSFIAFSPDSDRDLGLFPDERTMIIPVHIKDNEGLLYLSSQEDDANAIVWQNREDILFCINGHLTIEELFDLSNAID